MLSVFTDQSKCPQISPKPGSGPSMRACIWLSFQAPGPARRTWHSREAKIQLAGADAMVRGTGLILSRRMRWATAMRRS
ncbi:MAG: hypothetical protein BWZ02_03277 [Lentisphaerae bacterium ADurb.BinA184]|nr:MAG: hypothetical protein BWZ02_03277 [Lentisphaerae bacterium ADurb.BinA184]